MGHSAEYAQKTTEEFIKIIQPYCKRIEIAGSLRRGKSEITDVDLVIIPDKWYLHKFLIEECRQHRIYQLPGYKNGPKYKQFSFGGIKFELYFASKENLGLILLIRTGSADFSKKMLTQWKIVTNGGESRDGILRRADGTVVAVYEEKDFFQLIGQKYIEPAERN